jgi:hypothetical protein
MLASSKKGLNNNEARIIVSSTNFFLVFGRAIVYVHLHTNVPRPVSNSNGKNVVTAGAPARPSGPSAL